MSARCPHTSLMDIHPRELKGFVRELPTLPIIFQELFSRMQDPDAKISELADVIMRDQALTAKVLKLVNSAFYGQASRISTISRAIIIMGFHAVRSAALAVSVLDQFKDIESDASTFTLEGFWRHSIGVSCLAKQLSLVLRVAESEDAFVAGLLHDIGKLVMIQHFSEDVEDLCRAATEQHLAWHDCENVLYPTNHANIGRALFRAWKFPDHVVEAVSCHHEPTRASRHAELTAIIHIADYFSGHMGCECPGATPPRAHSRDAAVLIGITPDLANEAIQRAADEFEESLEILTLTG